MSALERVRQWARENRDPSILEVFRRTSWWSIFITAAGPLLAVLAYRMVADVSPEVLSDEGKRMLAIFVLAACYWITGAIPPFATAILIIGLEVFLLGVPAASPSHDPHSAITGWEQFVSAASAPIIVLMLGGFVLSQAAHKHGLDRVMAVAFIKPFGTRPRVVLLGIMLITANFSMWMSNTATAAMMITLIAPIAAQLDENSPLRKSFFLAVPLAANIGGMGTPIGTPPNAIAFGALQGLGIHITFIGWMVFAIPLMVMMLLLGWVLLIMFYPPPRGRLDLKWAHNRQKPGPKQWIVYATFSVTVGLWVTSHWTSIPIAAVALLPVVVFTATRLLDRYDINHLDWDILLLMAGGLALGGGMKTSGLAGWLIGSVPLEGLNVTSLLVVLCAVTLLLSTLMSNTAVANLLMPIALGLTAAGAAGGLELDLTPLSAGVAVALAASLAMCLPVSTPPNAIAFASGHVQVRDFVRAGIVIGIVGIVAVTVLCRFILP